MSLKTLFLMAFCLSLPVHAQLKSRASKSLLDLEPGVVYLDQTLKKPIKLTVIKEAPVFSDKDGRNRLGTLKAGQVIPLVAMTEAVYRVRGQGTRDGISGWVAPWAFSSSDPDFVANLKKLFQRQILVQNLIAEKRIALGMTLEELSLSRGKPTKTSSRKTADGESVRWEFIEYEDVKNYVTEVDRSTGITYRRLVSVTRTEKSKTAVDFENNLITAIEESEDHQGNNTRIIVPPLVFSW